MKTSEELKNIVREKYSEKDIVKIKGTVTSYGDIKQIKVDPKTGNTLGDNEQFNLANLMITLHYNLNLSTA